ncbi:hypothetical protein KKF60_02880, partial [Patescibacteria group bacterium]|nr:hypothetical protein [Patescibacteria group bacterium]
RSRDLLGWLLAAAGGEMRSNYFQNRAPFGKLRNRWVRRSQCRRPMRAPQRENSSPPRAAVKKKEEKRKNFKELFIT